MWIDIVQPTRCTCPSWQEKSRWKSQIVAGGLLHWFSLGIQLMPPSVEFLHQYFHLKVCLCCGLINWCGLNRHDYPLSDDGWSSCVFESSSLQFEIIINILNTFSFSDTSLWDGAVKFNSYFWFWTLLLKASHEMCHMEVVLWVHLTGSCNCIYYMRGFSIWIPINLSICIVHQPYVDSMVMSIQRMAAG